MKTHFQWLSVSGIAALTIVFAAIGGTVEPDQSTCVARSAEQAQVDRLRLLNARTSMQELQRAETGPLELSRGESAAPTHTSTRSASVATPPPPSPGEIIGYSLYDFQGHTRRIERYPGSTCVHFVWMNMQGIPWGPYDYDRVTSYRAWDVNNLAACTDGFPEGYYIGLDGPARAGYPDLDVDQSNHAHVALHQRADPAYPYHSWYIYFPTVCDVAHVDVELGGTNVASCNEVLWPRIATSRGGDSVVIHEVAVEHSGGCARGLIYYWRNTGGVWTGPCVIDSSEMTSYELADDPNSDKVALTFQPKTGYAWMNVAYYESGTSGYGWINGSELGPAWRHDITNYASAGGPQAWPDLSTAYDNSGALHVIYLEQRVADATTDMRICHWNSQRQTIRTAAIGYYPGMAGVAFQTLNLANLSVGIGDGSTVCDDGAGLETNSNYVYVCYTKFGGETPAEQADISHTGWHWNGELYLAVSNDGGNTWAPPINLTNTKTPGCNPGNADSSTFDPQFPDSVCRSENWASIGRVVSDIDITFISDLDAGGIPQGEGSWQNSPVYYLRFPGGTANAQFLCPAVQPVFAASLTQDSLCEFHAPQSGSAQAQLTISNLGNATMSGTISVTDFSGGPTLAVSGGSSYTVAKGSDEIRTVTMAANGAPEGAYTGSISITHDDPDHASPKVFPIELIVANDFHCSVTERLKTGVASPGSLQLAVSNVGRFGALDSEGGIWRFIDSSSSIRDASLLIAHGTQGPDTTVFLNFGTRASNGQHGFRALGDLVVDTSTYGSHAGRAIATSYMCTRDSVVGIKVSWYFPQNLTQDEFIFAQYKVFRNRPTVPITNLAIGLLVDEDVLPASRYGTLQRGATNSPRGDVGRKLIWQAGVDTAGHVISGTKTATRFRAGVAACNVWKGGHVGNSFDDLLPAGGPSDGLLYFFMQNLGGWDLFTDSLADLYSLVVLDRDKSIGAGETLTYAVVFVSDTISEASFLASVDAGLLAVQAAGLCSVADWCPCAYEPRCDGVVSDVLDVVETINRAFRGGSPAQDPTCPYERCDVDCSSATDVLDVTKVINVAFRGQTPGSQYDLNPLLPGDQ